MRTHEEMELLYVVRGKIVITLLQQGDLSRVLYRREVNAGGLAFFPAWQPHTLVTVDEPLSVYIAIHFLGHAPEPQVPASRCRFWSGLKSNGRIQPTELSSSGLELTLSTLAPHEVASWSRADQDSLMIILDGALVNAKTGRPLTSPSAIFFPRFSTVAFNGTQSLRSALRIDFRGVLDVTVEHSPPSHTVSSSARSKPFAPLPNMPDLTTLQAPMGPGVPSNGRSSTPSRGLNITHIYYMNLKARLRE